MFFAVALLLLMCLFINVHGSIIFGDTDKCMVISDKNHCNYVNITCSGALIMITRIMFVENKQCSRCLDVSGHTNPFTNDHDIYINELMKACSFKRACVYTHPTWASFVARIQYRCVQEEHIIDPCGGQTFVFDIGDLRHLVLLNTVDVGACSCSINGSTELTVQDFFTIFERNIGQFNYSGSVLNLENIVYDKTNNSNIIHSNISNANVSKIIITFDEHFQRLWLSVNVTENGTRIACTNLVSSTPSTPTSDVTSDVALTSYSTTGSELNSTTNTTMVYTNATDSTVKSSTIFKETTPIAFSQPTSTGTFTSTSGDRNTTFETAKASTSVVVYVASVSSFVVVALIVVGSITVIRHKRRNRPLILTKVSENHANRGRTRSFSESMGFENLSMQPFDNTGYECQTVSHIPHITKGSVKYAVAVPPRTYNYAFAQYDRDDSQKFRFEAEQTGASKSDAKLADGEEGLCHPYFCLLPLDEQGIGTTADGPCTDNSVCGAADETNVAQINMEQPHVYNHITFGRGATECESENGVMCSDEYAHISIDDVNATGNGRYYNISNINAGRSEPADDYCHIGPNNANSHAHVTRDDYKHVVL